MSILRAFFAKELRARLLRVQVIQGEGEESVEIGLGPWAVRMGEGAGVLLGLALAALLWLGFGLAIAFLDSEKFDRLLIGLFALFVFQERTRGNVLVSAIGLPLFPVTIIAVVDSTFGFGGTVAEYCLDTFLWSFLLTGLFIYAFREACTWLFPFPVPGGDAPPANTQETF